VSATGAVAFSPDGQQLAALTYGGNLLSGHGGTVYLWDIASGTVRRKFGAPTTDAYDTVLAFSPDGKLLVTTTRMGDDDKASFVLQMWNPDTGQKVRADRLPGNTRFGSAAFSPAGKLLALGCYDGSVLLLNIETGKLVSSLASPGVEAQEAGGKPLRFSRDGKTLFKRLSGAVGEWDVATGKLLRHFGANVPREFSVPSAPLALSPDGLVLAVSGVDNRIHFFDLAIGKEKSFDGHGSAVDRLKFAPDGNRLWTGDTNGKICAWDYSNAKELTAPSFPAENYGTLISAHGRYAVQCNPENDGIKAFDLVSRQERSLKWPPDDNAFDFHNLALAPDGKILAIRWFGRQKLELYDMPSLQLRHTLPIRTGYVKPRPGAVPDTEAKGLMIFSTDGQWLAACSDAKTLAVWNTATGNKTASLPLPEGDFALNGAFTPDGRYLVLDFEDGTVLLVEIAAAQVRRAYGAKVAPAKGTHLEGQVHSSGQSLAESGKVAVTADGKLLVHGGPDKVVRVYDVFTGQEVARFTGHEGAILAVAISNGGKYAATASTDTTVLLWELPAAR
jgi:WD40 repeat protein